MRQKRPSILLAAVVTIILLLLGWLFFEQRNSIKERRADDSHPTNGQRICPDAWYDNRMPGPAEETDSHAQYFVIDGERIELDSLDIEWIKANCAVNKPEVVQ